MYPDYECNNYPMSITDDDGPFLIMEAELFGGSVEKVGVAPDPKRGGPASWNLEHS